MLDDKGNKINVAGLRIVDNSSKALEAKIIYDAATLLPDGGVYGQVYSLSQDDDMGVQVRQRERKNNKRLNNDNCFSWYTSIIKCTS